MGHCRRPRGRFDLVIPTSFEPTVRAIGPMGATELAIAAVGGVPKGVHDIIINAHVGAAEAENLSGSFIARDSVSSMLSESFIIGGPIVIDGDGLVEGHGSATGIKVESGVDRPQT